MLQFTNLLITTLYRTATLNLGKEVSVSFASISTVVVIVYLKVLMEFLLQNVSPNGAKQ